MNSLKLCVKYCELGHMCIFHKVFKEFSDLPKIKIDCSRLGFCKVILTQTHSK